jgi:hypothetical protein
VILPDPVWSNWSAGYAVPSFVTSKAYRNCLDPGQTVLPLPATYGTPVLWQALNGFHFNIAAGPPAANPPASYQEPAAIGYITDGGHLGPAELGFVRTFIADKRVTSVVVDQEQADFFRGALDRIAAPTQSGGVLIYHLTPTASSCAP